MISDHLYRDAMVDQDIGGGSILDAGPMHTFMRGTPPANAARSRCPHVRTGHTFFFYEVVATVETSATRRMKSRTSTMIRSRS